MNRNRDWEIGVLQSQFMRWQPSVRTVEQLMGELEQLGLSEFDAEDTATAWEQEREQALRDDLADDGEYQ